SAALIRGTRTILSKLLQRRLSKPSHVDSPLVCTVLIEARWRTAASRLKLPSSANVAEDVRAQTVSTGCGLNQTECSSAKWRRQECLRTPPWDFRSRSDFATGPALHSRPTTLSASARIDFWKFRSSSWTEGWRPKRALQAKIRKKSR